MNKGHEIARSILVVDDNNSIREPLCFLLEEEGYSVCAAVDGRHAMEQVGRHKPDLIILDVMMPRMDGFEVCREIKNKDETRDIFVCMLSSNTGEQDITMCMEAGADAFVSKPYSPVKLLEKVAGVFG